MYFNQLNYFLFILIIVIFFSIYIYFHYSIRYVVLSDAYNKDVIYLSRRYLSVVDVVVAVKLMIVMMMMMQFLSVTLSET